MHEIKPKRILGTFIKDSYNPATTFIVQMDPDPLLECIGSFIKSSTLMVSEHPKKYKLHVKSQSGDDEPALLAMKICLGSVSENEVSVEFTRAHMSPKDFYEAIRDLRRLLSSYIVK